MVHRAWGSICMCVLGGGVIVIHCTGSGDERHVCVLGVGGGGGAIVI